ncbi:MAG: anti-sigma factor antagonist [Acidobacteria bacterium]|jgi:anti-sigma B factor antagonist|nr:MAG: anti-sigma factor antagonist [Acidobacteriota bacterium]
MPSNGLSVARFAGEIHGQRVLSFRGPLTLDNLSSFQTALQTEGAPVIIVDLAEVPYVDSAGLGSLVGTYVSRHKAGKQMILTGVNDRVLRLFEITGVEPLFLMFPSIDGAIDALTHPASA